MIKEYNPTYCNQCLEKDVEIRKLEEKVRALENTNFNLKHELLVTKR